MNKIQISSFYNVIKGYPKTMGHRILDFRNKPALRCDLLCNHSNSDLFMCEDTCNMLLSREDIMFLCESSPGILLVFI